eukprot:765566-Hanusia_phi.AAC.1
MPLDRTRIKSDATELPGRGPPGLATGRPTYEVARCRPPPPGRLQHLSFTEGHRPGPARPGDRITPGAAAGPRHAPLPPALQLSVGSLHSSLPSGQIQMDPTLQEGPLQLAPPVSSTEGLPTLSRPLSVHPSPLRQKVLPQDPSPCPVAVSAARTALLPAASLTDCCLSAT